MRTKYICHLANTFSGVGLFGGGGGGQLPIDLVNLL